MLSAGSDIAEVKKDANKATILLWLSFRWSGYKA